MLSKRFAESVFHQLEPYQHHKVILVTHVVTHPKFVVPLPHRIFDFSTVLLGHKILIVFMKTMTWRTV